MAHGKHAKKKEHDYRSLAVVTVAGVAATGVATGTASAATAEEWERVAQCESGGQWFRSDGHADSTGGLQIQDRTWADFGGLAIAPHAYMATKEQQIQVAEKILAAQGPRAWSVTWNGTCPGATLSNTPYGGGAVQEPVQTPAPTPEPTKWKPSKAPAPRNGAGVYVVKSGDYLVKIARAKYGDGSKWRRIYNANRSVIGGNPNLIYPGQKFKIPGKSVAKSVQTPAPVSSGYVLPVEGRVGDSLIVGSGGSMSRSMGGHSGLDISAPQGTPVRSAAAGTVVSMNASGGAYGLHVVVKHAEGVFTLYAHLSAITVSMGESVAAGQQIGNVGSTGNSGGPHLHFEVRSDPTAFNSGVFSNPLTWLRAHGVSI